jgi:hypothetical protein
MLRTAIFNILTKNEPYNPDLYRKSDVPPANHVEQAIKARLLGLTEHISAT